MRSPLAALALIAFAAPARAQIPLDGVFATTEVYCDCDASEFVFRTRRPLDGRAAPGASAPVVRTVDAGRLIEGNDWTEARTVVAHPTRVVLAAPATLAAVRRMPAVRDADGYWRPDWESGSDVPTLTLPAGARLAMYVGEAGGCFFSTDETLYYADDCWDAIPTDEPDARARAEGPPGDKALWLRLRPRDGRPAAWVEVDWTNPAGDVEVLCSTHLVCAPGDPGYRP